MPSRQQGCKKRVRLQIEDELCDRCRAEALIISVPLLAGPCSPIKSCRSVMAHQTTARLWRMSLKAALPIALQTALSSRSCCSVAAWYAPGPRFSSNCKVACQCRSGVKLSTAQKTYVMALHSRRCQRMGGADSVTWLLLVQQAEVSSGSVLETSLFLYGWSCGKALACPLVVAICGGC